MEHLQISTSVREEAVHALENLRKSIDTGNVALKIRQDIQTRMGVTDHKQLLESVGAVRSSLIHVERLQFELSSRGKSDTEEELADLLRSYVSLCFVTCDAQSTRVLYRAFRSIGCC